MQRSLELGTRASLLAMAQSRQIAAQLMSLHPGLEVQLHPVTTRGDRNQSVALGKVDDPDFFSAELDTALLDGEVDFCVHSLKDLPVLRHAGIARAALPVRENPRDVIVWRGDVMARLAAGKPLRIGASSRRRQGNIDAFLPTALPATGKAPELQFAELRGAVDARLARLQTEDTSSEALDGVVLALAGLIRLWNDTAAHTRVAGLLRDARWTVLPLARCPGAAGQGILAIECRTEDEEMLELLRVLHDSDTAELAALELSALAQWPATQRAALGATAIMHASLGPVCYVHGVADGETIERIVWNQPRPPDSEASAFNGIAWQRLCRREPTAAAVPELAALHADSALFVAYWHALQDQQLGSDVRLWTSGIESWRQLAARGYWIEGCGDHLGFDDLRGTLGCPVLGLPPLQDWTAVTSADAVPGWRNSGIGRVLATYDILPPADSAALRAVKSEAARATHCYWSNAKQFHALRAVLPTNAQHACGAGKTRKALHAAGIDAQPFPNGHEWQRWLQ
ncbi:MAG: hydroxymethylbilane synthase [Chromatiales bacterium]|nr:hydroxymethylbilane synthase [Chromatiales bacterium]